MAANTCTKRPCRYLKHSLERLNRQSTTCRCPMRQRRINSARLKRLCAKNRAARVLFQHLAHLNGKPTNSTTVDDLLAGVLADQKTVLRRRELVGLLRTFGKAGCGWFMVGRRGQLSRFAWAAPASSIAAAILGESPSLPAPAAAAKEAQPAQTGTGARLEAGNQLIHTYHLRRGLTISLALPADLTDREANRLGDFIRTVSFGAAGS